MELLLYQIAEKVNYSILDLRDFYIAEYGVYDKWNVDLDIIFDLNSDMDIDHLIEKEDLWIHPEARICGVSKTITNIQFMTNDDLVYRYYDDEGFSNLTNDQKQECYNTMISDISAFLFYGK